MQDSNFEACSFSSCDIHFNLPFTPRWWIRVALFHSSHKKKRPNRSIAMRADAEEKKTV